MSTAKVDPSLWSAYLLLLPFDPLLDFSQDFNFQINMIFQLRFFISIGFILSFCPFIGAQCTFTYTPGNGNICPGKNVTFTVTNPMAGAVYTWNLDGAAPVNDKTGTVVTFVYPYSTTPKNYVVTLYKDGVACSPTQTVSVLAGALPTLGVVSGGTLTGQIIKACGGSQTVTLTINNTSPAAANNIGYTIDWGDLSPVQNFTNLTFGLNTPVSHDYTGFGYKFITLTATTASGCTVMNTYQYFSGFAPANPGLSFNSSGQGLCAPDSLSFSLIANPAFNHLNNPVGTVYDFFLNNILIATYNQATVPSKFTYFFTESSCGKMTPSGLINAYSLKVVATNPCGISVESIVQPIRLSSKPNPDFSIQSPSSYCPGQEFAFKNTSTNINEIDPLTGECKDMFSANWGITPGMLNVDWTITGSLFNNNDLKVKFLKPGKYKITMSLTPQPSCGTATISKEVTILEPPAANANTQLSNPNGCSPLTVNFNNKSTGYQVGYNWNISPSTGWSWTNGNATAVSPTAEFTTPGTYNVTLTATNVCATSTEMV